MTLPKTNQKYLHQITQLNFVLMIKLELKKTKIHHINQF